MFAHSRPDSKLLLSCLLWAETGSSLLKSSHGSEMYKDVLPVVFICGWRAIVFFFFLSSSFPVFKWVETVVLQFHLMFLKLPTWRGFQIFSSTTAMISALGCTNHMHHGNETYKDTCTKRYCLVGNYWLLLHTLPDEMKEIMLKFRWTAFSFGYSGILP